MRWPKVDREKIRKLSDDLNKAAEVFHQLSVNLTALVTL